MGGLMDTNATTDDDVKAIKKLGEEFFAGVNAEDLDRRMATMHPDVVIMPPTARPSSAKKRSVVSPMITPRPMKKNAA
jgi:ketosteroid isomerase-like protein